MRRACLLLMLAGVGVAQGQGCLAPYANARCDLNNITFPAVPPQVGPNTCSSGSLNTCGNLTGVGTMITDPNFNNAVYRVTDITLEQPTNHYYTMEVTPTGSGEENLFNCSSPPTMIAIGNSSGWYFPVNFGPPTGIASTRMYATTLSSTNGMVFPSGSQVMGWGRVCPGDAGLLYVLGGTNLATLQSYNLTGNTPSGTPPSAVSLFDFTSSSNGLGSGFRVSWSAVGGGDQFDTDWGVTFAGGVDWTSGYTYDPAAYVNGVISKGIIFPSANNPGVRVYTISGPCTSGTIEPNPWPSTIGATANDNGGTGGCTWTAASSGQEGGAAFYNAVWRAGSGVRVLNLATDCVSGDWGPTGCISSPPCLASTHNSKLFKAGGSNGTLDITPTSVGNPCGAGVNFQWHYAASSLTGSLTPSCVIPYCGGHKADGLLTWVSNTNDNAPNWITGCVLNSTCGISHFTLTPSEPGSGVVNMDMHPGWNALNDTWPLLASTYNLTGATPTAWFDEIVGINPVSPGSNLWRFASTYATVANPDFDTEYSIGAVSQDGKWYMWTSDWMDTLGSSSGAATCTTGSGGDCRGDVFAVVLNPEPPAALPSMFTETLAALGFLGLACGFCAIKNSRRIHR